MTIAVYPGTFDPLHNGHEDVVRRAARLFDTVILGVAESARKGTRFDLARRVELATMVLADLPNVRIASFTGLVVEFARAQGASVLVRGVRTVADLEIESQMATLNRAMLPTLDTVFLTPSPEVSMISASLVRDIASHRGDVSPWVSPTVLAALAAA